MLRRYVCQIGFISLFFSSAAIANIDPWYSHNPSCVIDRGNPQRTGEYRTQALKKIHGLLWNIDKDSPNNILCYKDWLIIGGPKAIDSKTGETVWASTDVFQNDIIHGEGDAALYKDRLYLKTGFGKNMQFSIMDPNTGKLLKHFDPKVFPALDSRGIPLIYNDIIYFNLREKIIAYDLKTERILWQFEFGKLACRRNGLLSTDGERLYFGNYFNGCINTPITPQDKIHKIFALSMTGKLLWSRNILSGNYITVKDKRLFFTGNNYVYALDAATGKTLWQKHLGKGPRGAVAISHNILLVIAYTTGLHALDANTGQELWRFPRRPNKDPQVAGNVSSFPVIVDNIAYIRKPRNLRNYHTLLYALNLKDGKVLWHYDTEADKTQDFDILPYNGRIYTNTSIGGPAFSAIY